MPSRGRSTSRRGRILRPIALLVALLAAAPMWAIQAAATPSTPCEATAQRIHEHAERLRATGDSAEARRRYAEAAAAYEACRNGRADTASEATSAVVVAYLWYMAGLSCDAPRDAHGALLRGPDGDVAPHAPAARRRVDQGCQMLDRAATALPPRLDCSEEAKRDAALACARRAEQAARLAVAIAERRLLARAALPPQDPRHLPARLVPEIEPDYDADDALIRANQDAPEPVRVRPLALDPEVVAWIALVDAYVALNPATLPGRRAAGELALRAASLLYKNRHFDPGIGTTGGRDPDFWSARSRFSKIIEMFPRTEAGNQAAKSFTTTFLIEADFGHMTGTREPTTDEMAHFEAKQRAAQRAALRDHARAATEAEQRADALDARRRAAPAARPSSAAAHAIRDAWIGAGDAWLAVAAEVAYPWNLRHAIDFAMECYLRAPAPLAAIAGLDRLVLERRARFEGAKREGAIKTIRWAKDALVEAVDRRARLSYDLFEIPDAIARFRALARLDPDGRVGIEALINAARLASRTRDDRTASALDAEIVRRLGRIDRWQTEVAESAWRIINRAEASGNRVAWIRALKAFIGRRDLGPRFDQDRWVARDMIDRLRRGQPGHLWELAEPPALTRDLAHPPLLVIADPPGTAPGLERELR